MAQSMLAWIASHHSINHIYTHRLPLVAFFGESTHVSSVMYVRSHIIILTFALFAVKSHNFSLNYLSSMTINPVP